MNDAELLLDDVAGKVSAMFQSALDGGKATSAPEFGRRVADMLADDWGGTNVYIPKAASRRLRRRNSIMYSEFNGSNTAELALKYGISEQRLYVIIKEERRRRRVSQQLLPGISDV